MKARNAIHFPGDGSSRNLDSLQRLLREQEPIYIAASMRPTGLPGLHKGHLITHAVAKQSLELHNAH